jgi:hypothetical protein
LFITKRYWLILALAVIGFFCACTTAPITTAPSVRPATEIHPDTRILILQPLLRFEEIRTEAVLPESENQGPAFKDRLLSWAKKEVETRAYKVAEPESLDTAILDPACDQLNSFSNKLARGIVPEEAKSFLNSIASLDENLAILAQYLRVKVGPGGFWNQYTGEIHSTMSTMLLDVALISCRDGRVLWTNEVLLRNLVYPDNKEFLESLRLAYKTLLRKKEG